MASKTTRGEIYRGETQTVDPSPFARPAIFMQRARSDGGDASERRKTPPYMILPHR